MKPADHPVVDRPTGPAVTVYTSARAATVPRFGPFARRLGQALAAEGWTLVYGGGGKGLMGELARSCKTAGGRVVGIIPHFLVARELAFTAADELAQVDSMAERKSRMLALGEAFVILPGGYGTLEELSEVITGRILRLHDKPIVFVNAEGFFDGLMRHFRELGQQGFVEPEHAAVYEVVSEPEAAISLLKKRRDCFRDEVPRA